MSKLILETFARASFFAKNGLEKGITNLKKIPLHHIDENYFFYRDKMWYGG